MIEAGYDPDELDQTVEKAEKALADEQKARQKRVKLRSTIRRF